MAKGMVSLERNRTPHLVLENNTGAKLTQNDFAVVGGYAAIADDDIEVGVVGSFFVEQGIVVQTSKLHAAQNNFDEIGKEVYWDQATKTFSDTKAAAYYAVGLLVEKKDAAGVIVFDKRRYAVK